MFAQVLYWVAVVILALWGVWSAVWSVIYLKNGENGNLLYFAIMNALILIIAGLVFLIYTNQDWQWFWFVSKQIDITAYAVTLGGYAVMVILQFLLGFQKSAKNA